MEHNSGISGLHSHVLLLLECVLAPEQYYITLSLDQREAVFKEVSETACIYQCDFPYIHLLTSLAPY